MSKIIIVGLPRTGTTSISVALLEQGLKVAHTAFTQQAFSLAEAVSDAPCFSDYRQLDQLFPGSRFIYLDRPLDKWIPSMQRLLIKMLPELEPKKGYLNPVLKRSFISTFELFDNIDPLTHKHLEQCYRKHQRKIFDYFDGRDNLLKIDIGQTGSLTTLLQWLNFSSASYAEFPLLNSGKEVDAWKNHKHPNKINPNSSGPNHRKFFAYDA
tara:strand:+ start:385 stop:1017 length:633 start_codon:yes stop_codon:yes gene_type:complete